MSNRWTNDDFDAGYFNYDEETEAAPRPGLTPGKRSRLYRRYGITPTRRSSDAWMALQRVVMDSQKPGPPSSETEIQGAAKTGLNAMPVR